MSVPGRASSCSLSQHVACGLSHLRPVYEDPICQQQLTCCCLSLGASWRTVAPEIFLASQEEVAVNDPAYLGLLLTLETNELMGLREETDGLRFRLVGVVTSLTAAEVALAGVVEGKTILVTLWKEENRPALG